MDIAVIVAVVAGVLAVATAVVAFALARQSRTLQAGIAAGAEERERLESELDTLARLFADQAEQLADLQHIPPVELAPADGGHGSRRARRRGLRRPVRAAARAVRRRGGAAAGRGGPPQAHAAVGPRDRARRLRTASRAAIDDGMKVLGDVVRATLRESDAACRLGDVLAIAVLEDTDQHGALLAAERVRGRVEDGQHRCAHHLRRDRLLPGPRARCRAELVDAGG